MPDEPTLAQELRERRVLVMEEQAAEKRSTKPWHTAGFPTRKAWIGSIGRGEAREKLAMFTQKIGVSKDVMATVKTAAPMATIAMVVLGGIAAFGVFFYALKWWMWILIIFGIIVAIRRLR